MFKPLTVSELRAALDGVPDDAEVWVHFDDGMGSDYAVDAGLDEEKGIFWVG